MELTIGVQNVNRELNLDVDLTQDEVADLVTTALKGETDLLDLTNTRGGRILVPASQIAYVEFDGTPAHPVGFKAL